MKSHSLNIITTLTLTVLFSLSSYAESPTGGGNGGDVTRMKFIETGNNILKYYSQALKKEGVNLRKIKATLDIKVIKISKSPVKDNLNNPVDAIWNGKNIILFVGNKKQDGFERVFKNKEDSQMLVLHEMLRAVGVNDDNYVYSQQILSQPDVSVGKSRYYLKWCRDVGRVLELSLEGAFTSDTYEVELEELLTAVQGAMDIISPKHQFYFLASLDFAINNLKNFNGPRQKVFFMRKYIKYALTDLNYLDDYIYRHYGQCYHCNDDHGDYILSVLKRSLKEEYSSSSPEQGAKMLNTAALYSIQLIDSSYNQRAYACSKYNLIESVKNKNLTTKKLLYRSAIDYLLHRNCSHGNDDDLYETPGTRYPNKYPESGRRFPNQGAHQ